ncbi:MAG: rhodanese-like domain-containing protein [Planctomycetota bacterium]
MSEELPLEITCAEVKRRIGSGEAITLLDCREPSEHEIVRIADALLIPMGEVPGKVTELAELPAPLVVYCHHGMRSAQTAQWLRANGVPEAQSMAGGIDQWATDIDPSLPRY